MAARSHTNPAVSAEQYRLAQAVLSGTVYGPSHMSVSVAREIVDRTPKKLRSEYSKFTRNPFYGTDLDLETEMVPAWMYYATKQERDTAARMYEGRGKKVVLGHSMFGFSEGGGKKWRLRGVDHRGNPKKRPTDVDGNPVPQNYEMLSIRRNQGDALDVKKGLALENIPSVIVEPPSTAFGTSTGNWSVWTPKKTYKRAVKLAEKAYFERYPEKLRQNPRAASDDMYSSFHGEDPDEVIEYENEEHYHSHLAALGELVELKVKLVNGGTAVIGFEDTGGESIDNPKNKKGKYTAPGSGRGFWPFNSFTHTTIYHVGAGKKSGVEKTVKVAATPKTKVVGEFKGYKIEKQPEGYVAPGVDPAVFFSRMDDIKLFILSILGGGRLKANPLVDHYRDWRKKNPGPFHDTGKLIGKGRKALSKPMDDFLGTAGKVGGYLDDRLGRALNPANKDTGPVILATNENGDSLFVIGGDQSLDLAGLGITGDMASKESIVIGDIKNIIYHTHKVFDGKPEEFDYTHKAGEVTGDLPVLRYDRINRRLHIDGGAYKIGRPLMDTSPGLEN